MLALRRADRCRDHSSTDAICEPCWTDVQSAFDALNSDGSTGRYGSGFRWTESVNGRRINNLRGDPTPVPGLMAHTVMVARPSTYRF